MENTEYLLHLLRVQLDAVHQRMREEESRDHTGLHYHYTIEYKCVKPGCVGVDPVFMTTVILRDTLTSLRKEFPLDQISAEHH